MSDDKTTEKPRGKNQRPCPALNSFISPAECGSKRGSVLECPASCPFYPFGTEAYDLWLRIDENWVVKAAKYVVEQTGHAAFQRLVAQGRISGGESEMRQVEAFGYALHYGLIYWRDASGRTPAEKWEAEGWPGLNNDEKVMACHRCRSFVTLIEIQKVLNEHALSCVDLLAPDSKPFVLFDRSMARQALRYSKILTWLTHYPHFSRPAGFGCTISSETWPTWKAEVEQRLEQRRQERPELSLNECLAENLAESVTLARVLQEDFARRMMENMDVHQCVGTFRLQKPWEEIEAILRRKPDFEPEEAEAEGGFPAPLAFFNWLRRGESAELEKAMPRAFQHERDGETVGVVGSVRLYAERLVVETFSKQKHEFAKRMIEKFLGSLVRYEREAIKDLAKIVADRIGNEEEQDSEHSEFMEPAPVGSLTEPGAWPGKQTQPVLPPEAKLAIEAFHSQHYEKFLDDHIPALNGMTPRQAAKNPRMRAALIELMKGHIQSVEQNNQEEGSSLNLDWVLDELGLAELK